MSSKSFFARAAQREGRKGKAGLIVKRQRPPMPPRAVRVQVAERQVLGWPIGDAAQAAYRDIAGMQNRLDFLLNYRFGDDPIALDHDPALVLRPYNPRIKNVAARYTPHAHDPNALVYREKADHQQKTTGRKPGAERTVTTVGSDAHLAAKFRRLEGRLKPRRKSPIKSRGFAKGPKRKWPNRSFK